MHDDDSDDDDEGDGVICTRIIALLYYRILFWLWISYDTTTKATSNQNLTNFRWERVPGAQLDTTTSSVQALSITWQTVNSQKHSADCRERETHTVKREEKKKYEHSLWLAYKNGYPNTHKHRDTHKTKQQHGWKCASEHTGEKPPFIEPPVWYL